MKKTAISLAIILSFATSMILTACGGNTATDGNAAEKPSGSATEKATDNIIDDAKDMIDDMVEDATHGVSDGIPGGFSSRGDDNTLFPRGK